MLSFIVQLSPIITFSQMYAPSKVTLSPILQFFPIVESVIVVFSPIDVFVAITTRASREADLAGSC